MTDFTTAWTQCMQAGGMPVPPSGYSAASAVSAAAAAITAAADKFGAEATIGELIGAGLLSEEFAFAGAVLASAWVGYCIGCAAEAAGEAT